MKVNDDLTDQAERDRLETKHDEESAEQQERAVGNALATESLDEQHEEDERSCETQPGTDEPEEAERLVGEPKKEEKTEQVEQSPHVHTRLVDAHVDISLVLRAGHLFDGVSFTQREQWEEPEEITI